MLTGDVSSPAGSRFNVLRSLSVRSFISRGVLLRRPQLVSLHFGVPDP